MVHGTVHHVVHHGIHPDVLGDAVHAVQLCPHHHHHRVPQEHLRDVLRDDYWRRLRVLHLQLRGAQYQV